MTLSVGRFGLNPVLPSAKAWNLGGGNVSITGRFQGATLADSLALRAQLEGLTDNPEEDAVPIVWTADPTINGWYRIASVSCNMLGASLYHGLFEFSINAVRIASAAGQESAVTSRLMANAHSVTSVVPWHTAPPGARAYEWPTGTAGGNRIAETGTLLFRAASSHTRATARWLLDPGDAYKAAATLTVAGYPVVGHALPAGHDGDWALDNGLVRVKPSSTPGMIDVDHYSGATSGAAWVGYRRFRFRIGGGVGDVTTLTDLVVLHNAPHRVSIRLNMGPQTDGTSRTLDLTIRRGSWWLYGYLVPTGTGSTDWAVTMDSTAPAGQGTTLSGTGVFWPEPDTTHHRLLVAAVASTVDGAGIDQVDGDPNAIMDFGIGYANAAAYTTYGTDSSQVRQYLAAMAEQPRVVLR